MRKTRGMWGTCALVAAFLSLPASAEAQRWPVGHVYQGNGSMPFGVFDVTNGGNVSANFVALPGRIPGQLAWSLDGQTMFATQFDQNSVVAVTAAGAVTTFATNVSGPTGLLMTRDGRLLVASFNTSTIIDITAGGNFAGAPAFATGVSGPRNLVQLTTGEVLVASQSNGTVHDINYPAGGAAVAFATGLGLIGDVVQNGAGQIFVSEFGSNEVTNITAGGSFTGAPAFATGKQFMGLCVDAQGRLLANVLGGSDIFDITAGGNFGAATPFATNAGSGETPLDMVVVVSGNAISAVDEPAGANCADGGIKVTICLDVNASAECDAGEPVLNTVFVCDGADGGDGTNGADALITTTTLPVGDANCAEGGTRVDAGNDDGDGGGTAGNGMLETGEIDSTAFVCNGADGGDGPAGPDGSDGSDGAGALVDTTDLPDGDATCPGGGVRIDVGVDNGDGGGTAGNGVLEAGEIDSTSTVCNGADGSGGGCAVSGGPGSSGSRGAGLAGLAFALLLALRLRAAGRRSIRS